MQGLKMIRKSFAAVLVITGVFLACSAAAFDAAPVEQAAVVGTGLAILGSAADHDDGD